MKAIVLAAGYGKRLKPITDTIPKCLVEINKKALLENILDHLNEMGVTKTWIVTGYLASKVEEKIGNRYKNMDIEYVENSEYTITNNIYSLYLALKKVDDDIILSECDLYYEKEIFERLLEKKRDCTILTSKYNPNTMDGTVIVNDKNGDAFQMHINKHQQRTDNFNYDVAYKTVNVYWMKKEFAVDKLLPFIEMYMNKYDKNSYYELVIGSLMYFGNDSFDMIEVDESSWAEVDDIEDLKRAQERFGK